MLQTKEIEALFRTYYRPLCLYALHYLGDPDAVEDVVQESYTALWRQENPVANVRAWLYSAVRNRSIDALRKSGKTEPLPSDLDGPISDDEAEERSALEARLWTAVDALPEMRRKCLLLAKRDGLSYKEIADELNISEHTVRNHISRALETLREGGQQMINFMTNKNSLSFSAITGRECLIRKRLGRRYPAWLPAARCGGFCSGLCPSPQH